ncbi:HlyD family type I secretion periplasmic adaptor subunit [Pseudovibrio exalbescens]|uniref:HlyD family type I secretion periplasmic adaptor subunit n=1 Tax=Pseudovibrio exalbescens TaxID=197461 RepID=UPI002365D0F5|nr:HlyD family type I secretion periplasmic adaptor subunit [Pseudovibrio exalbescens]MDD7912152.1 HlyD family type I secretion periplasmic adaptor subunit [Pseudovibrio exalbescens]
MSNWDYATDIRASLQTRPPRRSANIILISLAVIIVALIWASLAELEEVTRGDGRVIPSRQIQVVQAPERGIVNQVLVEEGQIVEEGMVIVRVDDTGFSSQLGEIQQRQSALQAKAARLEAEALNKALVFPDAVRTHALRFALEEEQVFLANKQQQETDISVLSLQKRQKEQEREELLAEERKLQSVLETMAREVEINRALFERRVLPEIEFLRLQREFQERSGQLEIIKASIQRVKASEEELAERIESARRTFYAKSRAELADTRAQLAIVDETIKAAQDRVSRTDLRSPVYGVVNTLNITTLGAVVQPGEPLVEIVPLDDTLLIEARIRPQDVAFLHPGQEVTVKITAYDYSIYGGLKGKLERIAADSVEDEKGNRFFEVTVRTNKNYLGTKTDPLPIMPGMVASIDVLTGFKTVLHYLLKPINKVQSEALRER